VFTAVRATSGDLGEALAGGGRSQAGSRSSQRIGRLIVVGQIAITLVLVVGAGLLGRSLIKVLEVNPGFRVDKVIAMDISLPDADWTDSKAKAGEATFYRNLIDRLKQIPGVRKVGATSGLPLEGGLPNGLFVLMTQNELPKIPLNFEALSRFFDELFRHKERTGTADLCVATEGYFQALGILVRTRLATPLNSETWMVIPAC
jgi:putative ABC transport system permease protein